MPKVKPLVGAVAPVFIYALSVVWFPRVTEFQTIKKIRGI
jgi:hypothetical protein